MGDIKASNIAYQGVPSIMESSTAWILGVATATGLFSISKFILGFLKSVWTQFLRPPKNLLKIYGTWALVTGGANGIGQALAFELASKGLNLVILDRDRTQLEATTKMLGEKFGEKVEVRCILMDLNKLNKDEIVNGIREGIEGLDVGVLINCAGVAYFPRFLHEASLDVVDSIINVNAGAVTWSTMAVLPNMMRKKRGAIVNIGSGSAHMVDAYPMVSIYGATKAYVQHFSQSTAVEYKRYGIDVQCQAPFYIATKLSGIKKGNLMIPVPNVWSKASIRWIGYEDICVPYWPHYLLKVLSKIIPSSIMNWSLMSLHVQAREYYMKKDGDGVVNDFDLDGKKST